MQMQYRSVCLIAALLVSCGDDHQDQPDAGVGVPDGGGAPGDRGDGLDSSLPSGSDHEGGLPDSGTTSPASGTTTPDSLPDSGTTTPDSLPDSGTTTPDSGTTTPDSGTTTPDSG